MNCLDNFKENEYITTGEFAKILNMNDSTVRYYCDEFADFLKVVKVKKRRFFNAEHVEKFIYLKYLLKEKRLPIKLAKDYLATEDGKNMKPIDKIIENPLFSMMVQVSETLERFVAHKDINETIQSNDTLNFQIVDGTNVQKSQAKQREVPKIDGVAVGKQLNFHIGCLKSAIDQYETARQYELLDEMGSALSIIEVSVEKIKVLNNNLLDSKKL